MKTEYLFALVFAEDDLLTDRQLYSLRSEAHSQADSHTDTLCAQALDGDKTKRAQLTAWVRECLRRKS